MSLLHTRVILFFFLLTCTFNLPAQAQGVPDTSSFYYCNRETYGLWAFLQDLFNDITCPRNNIFYFLFILAVICALFIIIYSLMGLLKGRSTGFSMPSYYER
jgi:hypothetical protein